MLFPDMADAAANDQTSSTFADNLRLPVHRWYRYSAGFSGAWAQHVIDESSRRRDTRVFDPFVGCGTTLIAAENARVESIGLEAHPFVFRVARAKLGRCTDPTRFRTFAQRIVERAPQLEPETHRYPPLIHKCFTEDTLRELDCLRKAVDEANDDSDSARLTWLALVSILRPCSHAGTAQWQYVLPKKSKKSPARPFSAFEAQIRTMLQDMAPPSSGESPRGTLLQGDARGCSEVPADFATLVVTSPPYPNNYDYADATRLEMCFFNEIGGWGDLQGAVRQHLLRSCTQHVPERAANLHEVLNNSALDPIRAEILDVCGQLAEIRQTKGGKKTYHLMVACYFLDLALVWQSLRRVCDSPSHICFVIGDSAPYGVYVPVMDWLGRLALSAGFRSVRFERTRDRNVKWKNRKHRVPLCEGRLWVDG